MRLPGFDTATGPRPPVLRSAPDEGGSTLDARRSRRSRAAAFTLVEVMVSGSIGVLIMAGTMSFMYFSGLSVSGVTTQATMNQKAGNAIEFMQSRARFATMVTNDAAGTTLTLGFDDNPLVDSDGDTTAYNDKDHYERFQFFGVSGSTNLVTTNRLVYFPDITSTAQQVLVPSGVRNLPGSKIFTVTNGATVVIRFGVVDVYARDRYQSIDIQGTAVPLNRPATTNFIAIIP